MPSFQEMLKIEFIICNVAIILSQKETSFNSFRPGDTLSASVNGAPIGSTSRKYWLPVQDEAISCTNADLLWTELTQTSGKSNQNKTKQNSLKKFNRKCLLQNNSHCVLTSMCDGVLKTCWCWSSYIQDSTYPISRWPRASKTTSTSWASGFDQSFLLYSV